jgi:hypothetical protein
MGPCRRGVVAGLAIVLGATLPARATSDLLRAAVDAKLAVFDASSSPEDRVRARALLHARKLLRDWTGDPYGFVPVEDLVALAKAGTVLARALPEDEVMDGLLIDYADAAELSLEKEAGGLQFALDSLQAAEGEGASPRAAARIARFEDARASHGSAAEAEALLRMRLLGKAARTAVGAWRSLPSVARNEARAAAHLRLVADAQDDVRSSGSIDADGDGIGEYATFTELSRRTGVRAQYLPGPPAATGFGSLAGFAHPVSLPSNFGFITNAGFAVADGYAFMIFLPDASPDGPEFVHETVSLYPFAGLSGGTGTVGIDASETAWCAYAQPLVLGGTGKRRFFIDASGVVRASPNLVAQGEGATLPILGSAAYTGPTFESAPADGGVGSDGDIWTVLVQ